MKVSDHAPFQFDIITQHFIETELLNLTSKSMPDVLGLHGSILSIIADVITPSLYESLKSNNYYSCSYALLKYRNDIFEEGECPTVVNTLN